MRVAVTGAAGFIGSTLAERLVAVGHDVLGIDCFTPYYDVAAKRRNLADLEECQTFTLLEADLRTCQLEPILEDREVLFHQAGQPGVRLSWSRDFSAYVEHNILVTQRLLEAARTAGLGKFVYASSSSVYGNAESYPTHESTMPQPFSPYGVTKLAAEHLCSLYGQNWELPTISLRYFSVYGPRQRPDMAIHRIIEAALHHRPFPLYGTGEQIRDFTYVDDIVTANIAAASSDLRPGTVLNISGGSSASMKDVLAAVESSIGVPVQVDYLASQPGDVLQTGGSNDLALSALGWHPEVTLADGIAAQVRWHTLQPVAP